MRKVMNKAVKSKMITLTKKALPDFGVYDHYIAIDWSMKNMAIARLTPTMKEPKVIDVEADLGELKLYLKNLTGTKILTVEECNTAQWLYTELRDYVDRIIICDPCRNKLLSEGPKNDVVDACKLVTLLRNGLLKEVFHTTEKIYQWRKYVSYYRDLVKMGVRIQNQQFALYHGCGLHDDPTIDHLPKSYQWIAEQQNAQIELYQTQKAGYEAQFASWSKKDKTLKKLIQISGIGKISAVKIVAKVIDPRRFASTGCFLSYCGLVKNQKMSGGRTYGYRNSRYCRDLKEVFKTATHVAITGNNPIREYYDYLIQKGYPEYKARHAVARYIARIVFGMLKSGQPYEPYRWRKPKMNQ